MENVPFDQTSFCEGKRESNRTRDLIVCWTGSSTPSRDCGTAPSPDEVRTLRPDCQLLFLAAKLRYYDDRKFAGRFDLA